MNSVIEEFNEFYSRQLTLQNIPQNIAERFEIISCIKSTDTKEIYIVSSISSGKKYILKRTPKQGCMAGKNERDLLNAIDHPSIPEVYFWYEDEVHSYLVREYFEGISLDAMVSRDGTLPERDILAIFPQVCDALSYLHSLAPPIIHRDIKPQNIILRTDGRIGIIDLDSSRKYDASSSYDTVYLGTKQTAAPEQFGYGQTGPQTDIYALGILLIFMVTGSYDKSDLDAMPLRFKKTAEKCTEFAPKDRFQSVSHVKKFLLRTPKPLYRRKSIAAIMLILLCAGVSFAGFMAGIKYSSSETFEKAPDKVVFQCKSIERAVREKLGKSDEETLTTLDLGQISSLSIIGDLPFDTDYDKIQHNFDGGVIKYNDKDVNRGTVNTLADLKQLPFLKNLTLIYQQLSNLSGIEGLQLQELDIGYNAVSDLTPLKDMQTLTNLRILCNPIDDLSPLSGLNRLNFLQICGTNVSELTSLTSIKSLKSLDVSFMLGLDLTPLKNMKNLTKIYK